MESVFKERPNTDATRSFAPSPVILSIATFAPFASQIDFDAILAEVEPHHATAAPNQQHPLTILGLQSTTKEKRKSEPK